MRFTKLVAELQGELTQSELAAALGVAQSYLSMVLAGKRRPGRALVAAMIRRFPAERSRIIELFFASDYRDCDCDMSEENLEGSGTPDALGKGDAE